MGRGRVRRNGRGGWERATAERDSASCGCIAVVTASSQCRRVYSRLQYREREREREREMLRLVRGNQMQIQLSITSSLLAQYVTRSLTLLQPRYTYAPSTSINLKRPALWTRCHAPEQGISSHLERRLPIRDEAGRQTRGSIRRVLRSVHHQSCAKSSPIFRPKRP